MLDNFSLLYLAPALNRSALAGWASFIGAIFALAAYGLALVWGVMNLKNLAQGDFVIMGGYIAWWLGTQGVHPLFGLPVAAVDDVRVRLGGLPDRDFAGWWTKICSPRCLPPSASQSCCSRR